MCVFGGGVESEFCAHVWGRLGVMCVVVVGLLPEAVLEPSLSKQVGLCVCVCVCVGGLRVGLCTCVGRLV